MAIFYEHLPIHKVELSILQTDLITADQLMGLLLHSNNTVKHLYAVASIVRVSLSLHEPIGFIVFCYDVTECFT